MNPSKTIARRPSKRKKPAPFEQHFLAAAELRVSVESFLAQRRPRWMQGSEASAADVAWNRRDDVE